jgi:hypothetical protein
MASPFSNMNLLKLLLIIDSTIMLAFLMSHEFFSNALIFDIDKDFTIPSLYGYALLGGSALCIYSTSKKVSIYRPLAYLFVFFLVDDIHFNTRTYRQVSGTLCYSTKHAVFYKTLAW